MINIKHIIFILIASVSFNIFAGGEKYSEEGHAMAGKLFELLAKNGVCQDAAKCNQERMLYGEHGDRVNLNFYGITDRKVISIVVEYVSREGLIVTKGAPITISFFKNPKNELLGIKSFTADPFIKIEVNN